MIEGNSRNFVYCQEWHLAVGAVVARARVVGISPRRDLVVGQLGSRPSGLHVDLDNAVQEVSQDDNAKTSDGQSSASKRCRGGKHDHI